VRAFLLCACGAFYLCSFWCLFFLLQGRQSCRIRTYDLLTFATSLKPHLQKPVTGVRVLTDGFQDLLEKQNSDFLSLNHKFEASLGYIAGPSFKNIKIKTVLKQLTELRKYLDCFYYRGYHKGYR
jgi:hypothetical protein